MSERMRACMYECRGGRATGRLTGERGHEDEGARHAISVSLLSGRRLAGTGMRGDGNNVVWLAPGGRVALGGMGATNIGVVVLESGAAKAWWGLGTAGGASTRDTTRPLFTRNIYWHT
jgi:hypothetical protein